MAVQLITSMQLFQQDVPVCSSSPCQNGGTCSYIDCADSLQCLCKPGYTGLYCETWIGEWTKKRLCAYVRPWLAGWLLALSMPCYFLLSFNVILSISFQVVMAPIPVFMENLVWPSSHSVKTMMADIGSTQPTQGTHSLYPATWRQMEVMMVWMI